MASKVYYDCLYNGIAWESSLSIKRCNPEFVSCEIIGFGFQFDIHVGLCCDNHWVCIPVYDRGASLSYLTDTIYNFDTLFNILVDQPMIVTMITNALHTLSTLIS